LLSGIEVSNVRGRAISTDKAILKVVNLIIKQYKRGNKVILIGNGGSASIASHISTDFLKNCNLPSMAFNDISLITCLSNDLGYGYVFREPIKKLAGGGDILFSISSSGESENILGATREAREKGCFIITLSGFNKNNSLRKLGDINFYVPSCSYGFVEIIHLIICHSIVDCIKDGHISHR